MITRGERTVQEDPWSRREVLRSAGVAAVGLSFPSIVPSSVFGTHAPSNRLAMACIGLGIRGTGNMRAFLGQVENRFADGVTVVHMDNESSAAHPLQVAGFSQGVLFRGTEGWVFVNRSKIDANPKSLLQSEIGTNEVHLHESGSHHRDFLDAIRTGRAPACPIDVALRSDTICMVNDIAIRLGRTLRWDPQKEEFIGDAQANRLLTRPMRSPWQA